MDTSCTRNVGLLRRHQRPGRNRGEMRMTQSEPKKRVRSVSSGSGRAGRRGPHTAHDWHCPWPWPCSGFSLVPCRHMHNICVWGVGRRCTAFTETPHTTVHTTVPLHRPALCCGVRLRERDWQARARGGRPRASDRSRASSNACQRPLSVSSGRGDAGWRSERGRAAGVEGGQLLEHRERDDRVRRQLDKGGHEAAPEHENAVGGDAGARALER